MNIYLDKDGNPTTIYEEKNQEVMDALENIFNAFKREKEELKNSKKAEKLGYRFTKSLYYELSKYKPMSVEEFTKIDYDILNDIWLHYLQLTAYYNQYFEIVDNKQLFQCYAQINSRQYSLLEKSEDEDIRNLMNAINSAFVGLGFLAAESGNADVKGVNQRLRSSGEAGHSVVTAAEEQVFEHKGGMTDVELTNRLAKLNIKLIQ